MGLCLRGFGGGFGGKALKLLNVSGNAAESLGGGTPLKTNGRPGLPKVFRETVEGRGVRQSHETK